MINYFYKVLPLAVVLSACGTAPTTQKVNVPLPVRCTFSSIEKPDMPFDEKATKTMPLFQKTQLLLAQDENLKGYVIELLAQSNTCSTGVTK